MTGDGKNPWLGSQQTQLQAWEVLWALFGSVSSTESRACLTALLPRPELEDRMPSSLGQEFRRAWGESSLPQGAL